MLHRRTISQQYCALYTQLPMTRNQPLKEPPLIMPSSPDDSLSSKPPSPQDDYVRDLHFCTDNERNGAYVFASIRPVVPSRARAGTAPNPRRTLSSHLFWPRTLPLLRSISPQATSIMSPPSPHPRPLVLEMKRFQRLLVVQHLANTRVLE